MSKWQPIETAPRNGKLFLAGRPREKHKAKEMMVLNWPEGRCIGVWHNYGKGNWCGSFVCKADKMTHWMPLPEPPDA